MARKSRLAEIGKSAGVGLAAVTIIGAILGVAGWRLGSAPVIREAKAPPKAAGREEPVRLARAEPKKEHPPEPRKEPEKKAPPPVAKPPQIDAPPEPAKPRNVNVILADLKRIPARKSADDDRRRADLIGELFRRDPSHRQIPALLTERWLTLRDDPSAGEERSAALSRKPGDPIGSSAASVAATLAIEDPAVDLPSARKAIAAFAARSRGKSPAVANLLGKLADEKAESTPEKQDIYLSIIEGYPGTPAAELAASRLARLDMEKLRSVVNPAEAESDPRIGKVFDFAFRDAISGELVSSEALRGRVLVIDFWATWCPPCVASMPHMKEMYRKYAAEGVVFIGVNHDDGQQGLQKMLNFVNQNEIPWAQYHQADRELSKAWDVRGIPTVFIVDQEGRVVSARGDLDAVIPRLLDDAKPGKTARGRRPGKM